MAGPAIPVSEKGYVSAGTTGWWGNAVDDAEQTPELIWPKSIDIYDQMRRQEAQVISVLRAVTLPIRRTPWRIDPAGARARVVQLVSEDLGLPILGQQPRTAPRTKDRFSWQEHLRLALLMLPFGHSYFEQTYRIVDGKARLRKLGWRPPRTIAKLEVADDGGLEALVQRAGIKNGSTEPRIPVEQLVAYVNDREGGNWFGQSLLRPAFKYWFLKDRALRTQSQTLDRNGLGVPIYTAAPPPEGLPPDELEEWSKKEVEAGDQLAQKYRGGENAGAGLPNGAKLELLGVSGKLPDADPVIRYYDEQMARAVLAHFLNLGTETGSWALGSTFADFFTLSLQTVANSIADVATQHIVEDLVDLNFGPTEPAPRVTFDEIGSRAALTAEAVGQLISCGALRADDQLEDFLRTSFGMPAADPNTVRQPAATPAADQSGGDQ